MRFRTCFAMMIAALALVYASGCCETQSNPGFPGDSINCSPAPRARRTRTSECEVRGDLVYNLGQGVISNSNAVRLAGGEKNPRGFCLPGGVTSRCTNPLPESCREYVRTDVSPNPARSKAAPPVTVPFGCPPAAPTQSMPPVPAAPAFTVEPAAPQAVVPWEPGVATSAGYCAPVACPVLPESAVVCAPGTNLSECFTLSEEQLRAGPEVFVPASSVPAPAPAPEASAPAAADIPGIPTTGIPAADNGNETPQVTIPPLSEAPTAPASTKAEPLLPVPEVTDRDQVMEAILAKDGSENATVPTVELPPSLN